MDPSCCLYDVKFQNRASEGVSQFVESSVTLDRVLVAVYLGEGFRPAAEDETGKNIPVCGAELRDGVKCPRFLYQGKC